MRGGANPNGWSYSADNLARVVHNGNGLFEGHLGSFRVL